MDYEKRLENLLKTRLTDEAAQYAPGFSLQVFSSGRPVADLRWGETFRYYDLGSLTKVLFTTTAMMEVYEQHRKLLTLPLYTLLPWWPHQQTKVKQLLNHTSGVHWWRPFYKKLNIHESRLSRWEALRQELSQEAVVDAPKAVYSDVGFLLLAYVLEFFLNQELAEIWESIQQRLSLANTCFHLNHQANHSSSMYAPISRFTYPEPFSERRPVLQGEVADNNAWALGGVATHAGLFGTIQDVSHYGLLLRQALFEKEGSPLCQHATAQLFTEKSTEKGDFGLGFMKPSDPKQGGGSSTGRHWSPLSSGHLGYTGTSFWFDPKRDLLVTLLSHRYQTEKINHLRPLIHDSVVEALS